MISYGAGGKVRLPEIVRLSRIDAEHAEAAKASVLREAAFRRPWLASGAGNLTRSPGRLAFKNPRFL